MSKYILPAFIGIIILWAFIKRVPVYDSFVKGSKESISLILSVFPYICAVLIAVELFSLSGLNAYLAICFLVGNAMLAVLGSRSLFARFTGGGWGERKWRLAPLLGQTPLLFLIKRGRARGSS